MPPPSVVWYKIDGEIFWDLKTRVVRPSLFIHSFSFNQMCGRIILPASGDLLSNLTISQFFPSGGQVKVNTWSTRHRARWAFTTTALCCWAASSKVTRALLCAKPIIISAAPSPKAFASLSTVGLAFSYFGTFSFEFVRPQQNLNNFFAAKCVGLCVSTFCLRLKWKFH